MNIHPESDHPELDYEWLERLYQTSPDLSLREECRSFIGAIFSALVATFSWKSKRPRVRKFFDIQGLPIWYVYDPVTKQSFTAKSEFEMLNWLEGIH
jgi:hypothetical protein